MPTLDRVPTDLVADDLIRTYERGTARLNDLVTAALRRGLDPSRAYTPNARRGDATAAYRRRQLTAANAVLEDLRRVGPRMAPVAVARAYASAAVSVDNVLRGAGVARPDLVGQFGGLHQRAIQVMAANLERTLTAAVDRAGENLRTVFDRADAIEGALDPRTSAAPGVPFIGRRLDDPYRRVALEVLGERHVSLDTRRQMSAALTRRLIDEGATDAITGFVDRAGRRWPLSRYATMVARTTTREATSRATIGRMRDHGADLVTISSHPHKADECSDYDGQTFSLSGDDATYPVLDVMPPFHPQCLHVVTPADANLEDFERELGLRAARPTTPARRQMAAPAPVTPPPVRAPRNTPDAPPVAPAGRGGAPLAHTDPPAARLLTGEPAEAHTAALAVAPVGDEAASLATYTRGAYMPVNEELRGDPSGLLGSATTEQARAAAARRAGIVRDLDAILERQRPTTEALELHRYLYDSLPATAGEVRVGATIADRGYMSTSLRPGVYGPAKPTRGDRLIIEAPPGTRGIDVNALGVANNVAEHEYVLPRGSHLHITGVDSSGPVRVIRARLDPGARRPFVGEEPPRHDEHTEARRQAQALRELIDRDPGAPAGYLEALERDLTERAAGEEARTPYAALSAGAKRARTARLRDELGDSGLKLLRTAEGKRRGIEDAYVAGRLSRGDLEEELEDIWRIQDGRAERRTERERAAQFRRGAFPCFSCHRFKPRPSAVCAYCGADPVAGVDYQGGLSTGGDYWEKAKELDREHNYDTFAHEYGDDAGRLYDPNQR